MNDRPRERLDYLKPNEMIELILLRGLPESAINRVSIKPRVFHTLVHGPL
jgi:hypothetical protein